MNSTTKKRSVLRVQSLKRYDQNMCNDQNQMPSQFIVQQLFYSSYAQKYTYTECTILKCLGLWYVSNHTTFWTWFHGLGALCSKCQCSLRKPFGSFSKVTLTYIPVPLFIVNVCQEGLWQEPHSSIDFLLFRGCLDSHASIGCWASPAW